MKQILIVCGLLALSTSSYGAEQSSQTTLGDEQDVIAFNEAWTAYSKEMEVGDIDSRVDAADAALQAGRRVFAENDARLPSLMTNYAALLNAADRFDESLQILSEALPIAESIHGENGIELVTVHVHLAEAYADRSSPSKQLRHFDRALRIAAMVHGESSTAYANLLLRAGIHTHGSASIGQRYLRQAIDYFVEEDGEESLQAGIGRFYLGRVDFSDGRYRQATEQLLSSLLGFSDESPVAVEYEMYSRALLVEVLERRKMSDEATEHCIAIGKLSPLRAKSDYVPLVRVAPRYPVGMLSRGKQGIVDFEFTIDRNGFVRNPKIINDKKDYRGFEDAAIAAVERFRYAPRVVDGEPVAVDGIKTRISFAIK